MNTVSAHLWRGVNQGDHLTATLEKLETDDQSHISGTEHQNLTARLYTVQIHHRLRGSGADDARERPAGEGDHIFRGAGGHENSVPFIMEEFLSDFYSDFFIKIKAFHGGAQHHLYAGVRRFLQKLLSDAKSTDFCLMFFGTEKFMYLFK